MERCGWAKGEIYEEYHDREWGVPVHEDRLLFEFLVLEGAQAGLSWITILKKRAAYRKAFEEFDAEKVAQVWGEGRGAADGGCGDRAESVEDRECDWECAGVFAGAGGIRDV